MVPNQSVSGYKSRSAPGPYLAISSSVRMLAVPSLFNASLYRFNVSTEFMKVGRRVGSRIVPSARKEILGFCEFPRLEVIKITPFAPSAP